MYQEQVSGYLKEIWHGLLSAQMSFSVWRELRRPENYKRWLDVMNTYQSFFEPTIHAHLWRTLLGLGHPFDKTRRTLTFRRVMYFACRHDLIDSDSLGKAESQLNAMAPIIAGILRIRHNRLAHVSMALERDEVWRDADLSIDKIETAFRGSFSALDHLSLGLERNSYDLTDFDAPRHTRDVMSVLLDAHGSQYGPASE